MGLRVRKSIKIAPNTRLNISKSGASTSTRLAKGVSYRTQIIGGKKGKTRSKTTATGPASLRWWWFVIAIVCIIAAGTSQKAAEAATIASGMGVIGIVMLVFSAVVFIRRLFPKRKNPEETVEPKDQE
ncbi:MAG: DUF4236 domain-containing protein [Oscillospiraceae bacterium]|nr:DUF4236 domain-containing protein [Oscillospiraceae bacterium]